MKSKSIEKLIDHANILHEKKKYGKMNVAFEKGNPMYLMSSQSFKIRSFPNNESLIAYIANKVKKECRKVIITFDENGSANHLEITNKIF